MYHCCPTVHQYNAQNHLTLTIVPLPSLMAKVCLVLAPAVKLSLSHSARHQGYPCWWSISFFFSGASLAKTHLSTCMDECTHSEVYTTYVCAVLWCIITNILSSIESANLQCICIRNAAGGVVLLCLFVLPVDDWAMAFAYRNPTLLQ